MRLPDSYTVRLVDLPLYQGGMISESPDGHINVYINANLSATGQLNAALHEYQHWIDDDLNNNKDIEVVEGESDAVSKNGKLPEMMRARDLMPRFHEYRDWKDDVLLKLNYMED